MQLVDFQKLSGDAKACIDLIAGLDQKQPEYIARLNCHREWILYRRESWGDQRKITMSKVGSLPTMEDVLAFFRGKDLDPYCLQAASDVPESSPGLTVERKHQRKPIQFNGAYRNKRTGSFGDCMIEDISYGGMKFSTDSDNDIKPIDELTVSIFLMQPNSDVIKKNATARYVDRIHVGAEFNNVSDRDQHMVLQLG